MRTAQVNFKLILSYFQCNAYILVLAFGPPHKFVIAALKVILLWTFTLVQCSFISLSVTRMFLTFKVSGLPVHHI